MSCTNVKWLNGVLQRFQQYFLLKDTPMKTIEDPVLHCGSNQGPLDYKSKHITTEARGTHALNLDFRFCCAVKG